MRWGQSNCDCPLLRCRCETWRDAYAVLSPSGQYLGEGVASPEVYCAYLGGNPTVSPSWLMTWPRSRIATWLFFTKPPKPPNMDVSGGDKPCLFCMVPSLALPSVRLSITTRSGHDHHLPFHTLGCILSSLPKGE